MAHIDYTFFELKNGNRQYDAMANIPGVFQNAGSPDICPSGFLVTKLELMPASGYNGIKNGNTWIFNPAVSGSNTTNGEILELFAYESYDVNMVGDGRTGTACWHCGYLLPNRPRLAVCIWLRQLLYTAHRPDFHQVRHYF